MKNILLVTCIVLASGIPSALSSNSSIDLVRQYRRAHEHKILRELTELLSIPNVATDRENIVRNAELIAKMMRARDLAPRLLYAADPTAPPAIYGEWKTPGATKTLMFYAHYDGQPTDPHQWTGTLPWEPALRSAPIEAGGKILPFPKSNDPINPEWRIYGRSASDDKAGVMAILTAAEALRANQITPSWNIKFFFEGEEEYGSPHLAETINLNKNLLEADAWIICDGPVHHSGLKQIVFGVRGDMNVDLTVYGAKRALHSGHYGNWAPNPAMTLARLLGSMVDDSGHVKIAGWYDDVMPLGESERKAIAEAPREDDELRSQLGLAKTDGGGRSLLELIAEPSLNINGISSGDVGELARNVIPAKASAVLDLRLVQGNDIDTQFRRLVSHIRTQGFYVIDHEPSDEERLKHGLIAKVIRRVGGYNAQRTPIGLAISQTVIAAVRSTSERPVVLLPSSGGSLPLSIITEKLRTVAINVPIANYDNNQHAENENIRLQNLWDGVEIMAAIMTTPPSGK